MNSLISIDNLSFEFPDHPVLKEFTLELNAGERLGISGPNGSGKTTLLRLLMGLEKGAIGSLTILDRSCKTESDFQEIRKEVGYLFQNSDDQLFCPTVFEDVAFGPINQGLSSKEAHDIAHETLESLGLSDLRRRITYKLSYGQKRLVALATILAMKPKVLLLDEPTNGLDDASENRLTQILTELPQEMIIISHNQPFLEKVATRTQLFESVS